jgi:phosphoserine phosphatase
VAVHEGHIESIRKHKLRGHTVVVWSAGGAQWAERVVRELDLVPYVDACLAKPTWHYDDLPANEILGKRVYLDR